jgi:prepilin-type N-terminal cleavage/methylation domain-containing protein/prepilin-type processing-associated H-X9-DG protein
MIGLRPRLPRLTSAFTLIELLTVIAIIGILAAIIIPTVGKVRQSAKSAQCLSNLRQIGMAFNLYPADNKGRFPRAGLNPRPNGAGSEIQWYIAITPYIQTAALSARSTVFRCPSEVAEVDPARINTVLQYAVSYATERTGSVAAAPAGIGAKPEDIPNLSRTFLVVDAQVNQTGASVGNIIGSGIFTYAEITQSIAGAPAASPRVSFRHGDGVNAVYADGHTARLGFDAFKKELSDPITGRKLWDPFGP